ncbi:MAG: TIGR00366 family protein [Thermoanaerobaculales bacterium]|nr:TIGR00366 family protein [Thermoanaerobaculales bacterium]
MPAGIGVRAVEWVRRWLPDPFVFALLLTLATAATAAVWVGATPLEIAEGWYDGFWMLLSFGMQMVLILVTGYAIALAAPVTRLVDRLAGALTSPGQVYLFVLVAGTLLVWVSWGWVVLTAVLARELASRVRGVDYPYLVAATYLSSNAWVVGLSSTIPLLLNTPGNFLIEAGLLGGTIPVGRTLGSPLNLAVAAVYLVVMPAVMWLVRPRSGIVELGDLVESPDPQPPTTADPGRGPDVAGRTPADRMDHSVVLQAAVALIGLGTVLHRLLSRGFNPDLNLMIFTFLMLGLLLHRTPARAVAAMAKACSNISGIVFQYPFYAGIMGIMMATGLGAAIAAWVASVATPASLPVAAFVLGGAVNFAIPSAGGEWAVLGPPLVEAVRSLAGAVGPAELEARLARVAMAVAYGETLTNLLQPFFLLAVLPVMGAGVRLRARDLVGYLLLPFAVLLVIVGALVALVPIG